MLFFRLAGLTQLYTIGVLLSISSPIASFDPRDYREVFVYTKNSLADNDKAIDELKVQPFSSLRVLTETPLFWGCFDRQLNENPLFQTHQKNPTPIEVRF